VAGFDINERGGKRKQELSKTTSKREKKEKNLEVETIARYLKGVIEG